MAENTKLDVHAREAAHSRETRRLRRGGLVPGVLYGGGDEPTAFSIEARTLRHALAAKGAVLELSIDGGAATPAVLKDTQRHPVRGELMHVDLLRVDLKKPIQASVFVELVGGDESPGVKEGGVLEHITREVTVEALPTDIPESIEVDVSGMEMNDTLTLEALKPPAGVTLVDDVEITLASVSMPRVVEEETDVETETELVGDGEEAAADGEGDGDGDGGGDDAAADGDE